VLLTFLVAVVHGDASSGTPYSGNPTLPFSKSERRVSLLGDYNGNTGAALKEYVWIDDLPIAVVDSTSGAAQPPLSVGNRDACR
jgi:hypothetical protein